MKTSFLIIFSCFMLLSCQNQAQTKKEIATTQTTMKQSIYTFKVEDLEGKEFDFETLRGKKVMIVNTASKCGLTPQ